MITEVEIKEIDHSSRYLYPSRRIEIKTRNNPSFYTPIRAATSYEYAQKAKMPSEMTYDNPISIDIQHLTIDKFTKLLNTNEYYLKLLKTLELNNRLSQYSYIKIAILKLATSDKEDDDNIIIQESPMTMIQNYPEIRDRFLRYNIRLQQSINLNPITIPFMNLPFEKYREIVKNIVVSLEKINLQPLFFLDMNYANFEKGIDLLINTLELNMVGFYHRSFHTAPLSYETLRKYIEKDVAFIDVNVIRYDTLHDAISTMHYLPFFGNDIYAVKTPVTGYAGGVNPLRSIRIFDRSSLCLNIINSAKSTLDDLKYEYRNDFQISNMLDYFYEAETNQKKLEILRAFSKVSEIKSSSTEFENLQEYVSQNSINDYIQERNILQKTLRDVTGSQIKLDRTI